MADSFCIGESDTLNPDKSFYRCAPAHYDTEDRANGGERMRMRVAVCVVVASLLRAQGPGGRGGPPPGPPPPPRAAARIDITGYWVSLVTEDWRHRQFTPPKGDYT